MTSRSFHTSRGAPVPVPPSPHYNIQPSASFLVSTTTEGGRKWGRGESTDGSVYATNRSREWLASPQQTAAGIASPVHGAGTTSPQWMTDLSFPFSPSLEARSKTRLPPTRWKWATSARKGRQGSARSLPPWWIPCGLHGSLPPSTGGPPRHSQGAVALAMAPPHAQPRLPAWRQANRCAKRVGASGDLPTTLSSTSAMEVSASTTAELLCSSSTHEGWGGGPMSRRRVALLRSSVRFGLSRLIGSVTP
jgi:hypothetical protein